MPAVQANMSCSRLANARARQKQMDHLGFASVEAPLLLRILGLDSEARRSTSSAFYFNTILILLLAPSACNRATITSSHEPTFAGPRSISRLLQGLEAREVLAPSAILSFRQMYEQRLRAQGYTFADLRSVPSTFTPCDLHETPPLPAFS